MGDPMYGGRNMHWAYQFIVNESLVDNFYGLCNSRNDWDTWMAIFPDSAPIAPLFTQETLDWLEDDCQVHPTMKSEVESNTVAEPRGAEEACQATGVSLSLSEADCKHLFGTSKLLCEVQFCSDDGNKNTGISIAAADSDSMCTTAFLAAQVCTTHVDYKFYGCSACEIGEATTVSTWTKCQNNCLLSTGCRQAVYDKRDGKCALYSCASLDDADGTPGMSLNYISAVCYMDDTLKDLEKAVNQSTLNRLEPPADG